MNFVNTSLFVGDLPKFCGESDLEQLFIPFGPLLDAKIKRNSTTGKTLSYGFVTFATESCAQEALKNLDGAMFSGRKLRVRWAMYNAKGNATSTSAPGSQSQLINSVYVRFVTPMLDRYITEEDLHFVFDGFGNVVDASIKESSIDHRLGRQSGYGFVHFSCDQAGIESAFKAVNAVDNSNISNVVYNVELSKNLLKLFGEYQLQQQQLQQQPGTAPGGIATTTSNGVASFQQQATSPSLELNNINFQAGSGMGSGIPSINVSTDSFDSSRFSQRSQQNTGTPSTPTAFHSPVRNFNNNNNNSNNGSNSGNGRPLRPASFHDLNSVRNAAAFQQQMQQHNNGNNNNHHLQYHNHNQNFHVTSPSHHPFQQQQQSSSSPAQTPQQPMSFAAQTQQSPSVANNFTASLDVNATDLDMARLGFAAARNGVMNPTSHSNTMNTNMTNNNNKLLMTRSASRLTSLPSNSSPYGGLNNNNNNNNNNMNINNGVSNNMNMSININANMNRANMPPMGFPHSPSAATVQYEYRNNMAHHSNNNNNNNNNSNNSNGINRKFTFDNSHADTVALEGTFGGSLSKFNSSDSYEKMNNNNNHSSSNNNILGHNSQSSDVFRALPVKNNSFMSSSQGSLFSLTESNMQQQQLHLQQQQQHQQQHSAKSLKRGNSNMSEVSIDTELEVTRLSLDQKLLGSKDFDDFLFSSSNNNNNSNTTNKMLVAEELMSNTNSNNSSSNNINLNANNNGRNADLTTISPTKMRDGIASRMEEKNKLSGMMMPPPIGSPIMDHPHRRNPHSNSHNNSNSGANSTIGSEGEFSGYRSRQDSAVNSGNVSRINSFTRNNGDTANTATNNNNNNNNNNSMFSAAAMEELRGGDILVYMNHTNNNNGNSTNGTMPMMDTSAMDAFFQHSNTMTNNNNGLYNHNNNVNALRYSLDQMSLGSGLDSTLEYK